MILRAAGLYKSFDQTEALRGADLDIGYGEVVAIMGPSGSGKSTLLHCLAGILPPDRGRVEFDGARIDTLSDAERTRLRRTTFGFVFQFGQLVPDLPAIENIALPLLLAGRSRKDANRIASEWLARLGLSDLEKRRPDEMSGGQGQRVAVARALAVAPKVLFADEPTGALDSVAGEQVMELLVGATREERTTVVIVTHEPQVAAYAERTVFVRDGRVTGTGST